MLPRANGIWVPEFNDLIRKQCSNNVWYQSVCSPISSPNDIACSRDGDADSLSLAREIASFSPTLHCDFQSNLAATVGIETAKPVAFTVEVVDPAVFIHFVGCDHNHRARATKQSQCFQQMEATKEIYIPCSKRVDVGFENQWLSGQMKHKLWINFVNTFLYSFEVA